MLRLLAHVSLYWQIVSRLKLEHMKSYFAIGSKPHFELVRNAIQIRSFLGLDTLAAPIRFRSVFYVTPSVTHNKDAKSRLREVHQSKLPHGEQQFTHKLADINCQLCVLNAWLFVSNFCVESCVTSICSYRCLSCYRSNPWRSDHYIYIYIYI